MWTELRREFIFAWRDQACRWTSLLALGLSICALILGSAEINHQHEELSGLKAAVSKEREQALADRTDPGDIAYQVFHLTYDEPTSLAFAAVGLRDELPWKHRLRMLALEGQIYETDTGNPELAALGQLDFAFLISMLLPLFAIGLLFDLQAKERRAGRYELLCATSIFGERLFLIRAALRSIVLLFALALPFGYMATIHKVPLPSGLGVLAAILLHILFWMLVCYAITKRQVGGVTAALILLGIWIFFAVVVPVLGKARVDEQISVPHGGDILLTQRETVNAAWDLPKSSTMKPFLATHPEWVVHAQIDRPFEWKWYYAFQQVGDQAAAPISEALYAGMSTKDEAMGRIAWLSPPLLTYRTLTTLARTDVPQHLHYIHCARDFHASLRQFYYPMLFGKEAFSLEEFIPQLPRFEPCTEH